MSNSYGTDVSSEWSADSTESPGKVEVARHEAGEVKDTATEQAKDVIGTAKDEASSVISEAKSQAKDLFAQTQREVKDQAQTQQQRIAVGLHAVSSELSSMASNSDQNGLATDLVREVSGRLSSAASWLGDRDPSGVLTEVKRFARRKPGTFILGALVAGVVVGRLTRALAANAADDDRSIAAPAPTAAPAPVPAPQERTPEPWQAPRPVADASSVAPVAETPIYAQAAPSMTGGPAREDGDDRPDAF